MPEMQDKDKGGMEVTQNKSMKDNPLRKLYEAGQSPWYDNIERRLFKSGEFRKLIEEYGIVGVTSNPTIFDRAISSSNEYDERIKALARQGLSSHEIYDELAIEDIGLAADMLMEVYKKTNGLDGYVSIEVLPEYAHDPGKTIEYARKIFQWLDRKNILIKVPGTREALPAITELIAEGINVNVTLLFSLAQYEAAAMAYIEGLKKRLRGEERLDEVVSVASVFVSRIDTKIDKMLDNLASGTESKMGSRHILDMRGKAATANSKMIYKRFKEIFSGRDFGCLAEKGAKVQRVLWASTSAKNPYYRDVKYVEEIIGADTINTMPHQTLVAFYDHGIVKPSVEEALADVPRFLDGLQPYGIDVNKVCEELQREGIKAFVGSFDSLIGSIKKKSELLR